MKVMLTGAAGQLGMALQRQLPEGVVLVAFDRAGLDIGDAMAVRAAVARERPHFLLNAAAYTAVDRAEQESEAAARINAEGVAHLARAASDHGARLVHVSTDFVFDGHAGRPYQVDDTPHPQSVYGDSKLAGERAALAISDSLVVRTAWVYSAHGSNFVRTMLRLMAERDEVRVVADQIGTPTHAASLARAIWALIRQEATGIVHITDAGVASWYDFAQAIQEEALEIGLLDRAASILPIATADYPTPAIRPAFSVLDKNATWALLGGPARHWRVELRLMLAELKEQGIG